MLYTQSMGLRMLPNIIELNHHVKGGVVVGGRPSFDSMRLNINVQFLLTDLLKACTKGSGDILLCDSNKEAFGSINLSFGQPTSPTAQNQDSTNLGLATTTKDVKMYRNEVLSCVVPSEKHPDCAETAEASSIVEQRLTLGRDSDATGNGRHSPSSNSTDSAYSSSSIAEIENPMGFAYSIHIEDIPEANYSKRVESKKPKKNYARRELPNRLLRSTARMIEGTERSNNSEIQTNSTESEMDHRAHSSTREPAKSQPIKIVSERLQLKHVITSDTAAAPKSRNSTLVSRPTTQSTVPKKHTSTSVVENQKSNSTSTATASVSNNSSCTLINSSHSSSSNHLRSTLTNQKTSSSSNETTLLPANRQSNCQSSGHPLSCNQTSASSNDQTLPLPLQTQVNSVPLLLPTASCSSSATTPVNDSSANNHSLHGEDICSEGQGYGSDDSIVEVNAVITGDISEDSPATDIKDGVVSSMQYNYSCDICATCFSSSEKCVAHRERVHGKNCPYICNICRESYEGFNQLRSHQLSIHSSLSFVCQYCIKCFDNHSSLQSHLVQHEVKTVQVSADSFNCPECGQVFNSCLHLRLHISKQHVLVNSFRCQYCEFHAEVPQSIIKHSKVQHPGKQPRFIMLKDSSVKIKTEVSKILENFRDLKPFFSTNDFYKTLISSNVLRAAGFINSDMLEIFCPYCNIYVINFNQLKEHEKKCHEKPDITAYNCCICDVKLTTLQKLQTHLSTAHNFKPSLTAFACPLGGCGFWSDLLRKVEQHLSHTHPLEEMPFQCCRCERRFSTFEERKRHFNSHYKQDFNEFKKNNKVADTKKWPGPKQRNKKLNCTKCQISFTSYLQFYTHKFKSHSKNGSIRSLNDSASSADDSSSNEMTPDTNQSSSSIIILSSAKTQLSRKTQDSSKTEDASKTKPPSSAEISENLAKSHTENASDSAKTSVAAKTQVLTQVTDLSRRTDDPAQTPNLAKTPDLAQVPGLSQLPDSEPTQTLNITQLLDLSEKPRVSHNSQNSNTNSLEQPVSACSKTDSSVSSSSSQQFSTQVSVHIEDTVLDMCISKLTLESKFEATSQNLPSSETNSLMAESRLNSGKESRCGADGESKNSGSSPNPPTAKRRRILTPVDLIELSSDEDGT